MPALPEAFGFANGLLPILLLVALAILLPLPGAAWAATSQSRLFLLMLAVAALLHLVGAGLLAYLTRQEDAAAQLLLPDLLQRSVRLGIAWGPVWLLVWLVRAQGIERRRGLGMGRGEKKGDQDDRDA